MGSVKWLRDHFRRSTTRLKLPAEYSKIWDFWLFPDACLIALDLGHQFVDRVPAIIVTNDILRELSQFPVVIVVWDGLLGSFTMCLSRWKGETSRQNRLRPWVSRLVMKNVVLDDFSQSWLMSRPPSALAEVSGMARGLALRSKYPLTCPLVADLDDLSSRTD
jgi:hypothetical protein